MLIVVKVIGKKASKYIPIIPYMVIRFFGHNFFGGKIGVAGALGSEASKLDKKVGPHWGSFGSLVISNSCYQTC